MRSLQGHRQLVRTTNRPREPSGAACSRMLLGIGGQYGRKSKCGPWENPMTYFDTARVTLATRRSELLRRIALIESDLERYGSDYRDSASHAEPACAVLHEFMTALERELGQVESAIRRIDSKEYDCCMQCGGTIRDERLEQLPYAVNCANCSSSYPMDYIHSLRTQHSSIRRTIFSVLNIIGDVIDRCERDDARPDSLASTFALLSDLGRQLPERFRLEEQGGYLAEALSVAPRFSRRATELMQEHASFSRRIGSIVKAAEAADSHAAEWRVVQDDFRQLSLELLAHEQSEADIVESAFLDDVGGAD
jgi:DnaK suppressor protein